MNQNGESMQEELYEEEWVLKTNSKEEYRLSKKQAWMIQEAIASGNRGIVMFDTFSISIPYIVDFYRLKRFVKESRQLTSQQQEQTWTEEDRLNALKRVKELKEKLLKI